jgi:two-component system, chemotaxis family, protein-glutamate methylesterase/glutaminase
LANRDILAIGTSAGGGEALRLMASKLPADLPASVLVVIHLSSQFRSALDSILSQAGPLTANFAKDGEKLEKSRIYIGPPESHLLVDGDRLRLGRGPRENNARPAIDPLFRSIGLCCGVRAIGVVLTGTLGDGAAGLKALKQCGGVTVVQDPSDAAYPEMPVTALSRSKPDHVVGIREMPAILETLVRQLAGLPVPVPESIKYEVEIARSGRTGMSTMDSIGQRSLLACPDCHAIMWEINEADLVRYRCRVGHAYAAELLSIALDERIALAERLHKQESQAGRTRMADSWERKAREFEQEANVIRHSIRRVDEIAAHAARD